MGEKVGDWKPVKFDDQEGSYEDEKRLWIESHEFFMKEKGVRKRVTFYLVKSIPLSKERVKASLGFSYSVAYGFSTHFDLKEKIKMELSKKLPEVVHHDLKGEWVTTCFFETLEEAIEVLGSMKKMVEDVVHREKDFIK
jgi:hypothetical protein